MTSSGRILLASLIGLLGLSAISAHAVEVVATVDRNEVAVGDTFSYSVRVSSSENFGMSDPRLPDLGGFELLSSGESSETRSTFSGGTFQVEQARVFNYLLAATRPGELVIGPTSIVVDGRTYSTQPIRMRVLSVGQVPPQARPRQPPGVPSDPMDEVEQQFNQLLRRHFGPGTGSRVENPDDLFFIRAETDRTQAYVGQQVTATWYLYSRGQVHDIDTLKYPALSGFWKEEIELATRLNFQPEVVNGVMYQKALLASYALFPIKAGKASVDAYRAKCTVSDMGMIGFQRPMQATKESTPITIEVLDLPQAGRPANFTGAVGQFSVSAKTDQTTVPANQPLVVRLRFDGRGNAKLIDLPKFDLPAGWELYDSKPEAKFFRDGTSFKEFTLTLVPRQAGDAIFPAIALSAFDPAQRQYVTVTSDPISFRVLPGAGPQVIANSPLTTTPKVAAPTVSALPGLIAAYSPAEPSSRWLVWLGIYALVLMLLTWRGVMVFGLWQPRVNRGKLIRRRLANLESLIKKGQWRKFGSEGTNIIYLVLADLSRQGRGAGDLEHLLEEVPPSVRRTLGGKFRELLRDCELLSFAPEEFVGQKKSPEALTQLHKRLEVVLTQAVDLAEQEESAPAGVPGATT